MKAVENSNDNQEAKANGENGRTAKDAMAELCRLLKGDGVDRDAIASAMLDEMFKMLEGNPFRSPGDEAAITADQAFLWRIKHRVVPMSEQWDKGWVRIRREKMALGTFFARAVAGPRIVVPAPVKRRAPPPDYDAGRHDTDLYLLRMRRGHVYTEREVMTRYNRRVAQLRSRKTKKSADHVVTVTAAMMRVVGWMKRTGQIVKDQKSG